MARFPVDQTLAGIPIFSECTRKELKSIATLMTSTEVSAGQALTTQGESGREFMIIESGYATVRRNGRKLRTLGPGDFFGELAMLAGGTRTATVIADTDLVIWALGPQEFSSLMRKSPSIAQNVLLGAVKRLYEENQRSVQ